MVWVVSFVFFIIVCLIVGIRSEGTGRKKNTIVEQTIKLDTGSRLVCRYDDERFVKYVKGRECRTEEDLTEWSVIYGLCCSLESTIMNIERGFDKAAYENVLDAKQKWHDYYDKYRNLCLQYRIWNRVIGDEIPFVASKEQLKKESDMFEKISHLANNASEEYERIKPIRDDVLKFVSKQEGKRAQWSSITKYLSQKYEMDRKECSAVLRKIEYQGIIKVYNDKDGHLSVRKKPVPRPKKLPDDFVGPYDASMYADIDLRTKLKVRYTVGKPFNLDDGKGYCDFESLSQEAVYHTSLTQCTCPAYVAGHPCKHMVALAVRMHLIRI